MVHQYERISGRDYVDSDTGDIRHMSDLTPDMEPLAYQHPADVAAVRAVKKAIKPRSRKRNIDGRSGRDRVLDAEALIRKREVELGRLLTDDESNDAYYEATRNGY